MSEDNVTLRPAASDDTPDARVTMASGPRSLELDEDVKDEMDAHVGGDTTVERGGVLVGNVDPETGSLVVTGAIAAKHSVSAAASLTFTHETWEYVNDVMGDQYPDKKMVGWYHSHPGFGIFLSEYDTFIHTNFFSAPWQVAYVVDPLLGQAGFFGWEAGQVVRYQSWHVLAHGSARAVQEPSRGSVPPGALLGTEAQSPSKVNPWATGAAAGLVALLLGIGVGYAANGGSTASPPPPNETFRVVSPIDNDLDMTRTWTRDATGTRVEFLVANIGNDTASVEVCSFPQEWTAQPGLQAGLNSVRLGAGEQKTFAFVDATADDQVASTTALEGLDGIWASQLVGFGAPAACAPLSKPAASSTTSTQPGGADSTSTAPPASSDESSREDAG